MEIGHIIPHIEALVFASDKPLTPIDITELVNNAFGFMDDKITMEQVQTAIEGIVEKYRSEFYPFEMRESGGGWQFLTKKDYHKTVAQLNGEKFLKRLSTAALETLAIIAYKQPLAKSEIESIRGVNCDYSIQKLLEKELIVISGRNEELPGKPLIYNTSRTFMDYFGINSSDDLPKLKEIFNMDAVNPTVISNDPDQQSAETPAVEENGEEETESSAALIVTENGELLEGLNEELVNEAGEAEKTDLAALNEEGSDQSTAEIEEKNLTDEMDSESEEYIEEPEEDLIGDFNEAAEETLPEAAGQPDEQYDNTNLQPGSEDDNDPSTDEAPDDEQSPAR